MRMLLLAKLFCKDLLLLLAKLFRIQLLCTKGKPNAWTGMVQRSTAVNKQQLMEKIKNVPPPKDFSIHHILQFNAKWQTKECSCPAQSNRSITVMYKTVPLRTPPPPPNRKQNNSISKCAPAWQNHITQYHDNADLIPLQRNPHLHIFTSMGP